MLTCGECKYFEWATGITGRKLRKKAGRCMALENATTGDDSSAWPISFTTYAFPGAATLRQHRPCYHDSQHASQCAAFEKKEGDK